jgi:glycosyltransferase involved in cell wall biosynthesis
MIAAVSMCRDEEDVILPVIVQLLAQGVDHIWVADNLSSDKTRPLLEHLAAAHPITIIDDDEPGYYQPEKLMRLAAMAGTAGADWILPFDADEWWSGAGDYTIAEALRLVPADVAVNYGYDHIPRRTDHDDPNPIRRMGWRRTEPQRLPKVAYRWAADARLHYGNHDVDHAGRREHHVLEYRHFGYRSLEQMARKVRQGKAALDAAPRIHEMYGSHWRTQGALSDAQLAAEWEALLDEQGLVYDPAPMP